MVQNPKGGGLSSTLGGSQMMGGVQKTTDFLDKSTWTLGAILIVLIMLSSLSFTGSLNDNNSKIIDEVNTEAAPKTVTPAAATPAKTETAPAQTEPAATTPAAPATK